MILADLEPGIFFLFLWGLFSWFISNKKKKKMHTDSGEVVTKPKPKEDLFVRLQKLQDHLSKDMDIFPSVPQPVKEEEFIDEEYDNSFRESEILEPELEDIHENEEYIFTKNDKPLVAESTNWLKKSLRRKSDLKKLMVIKEILGEPRSLKPYTEDNFQ